MARTGSCGVGVGGTAMGPARELHPQLRCLHFHHYRHFFHDSEKTLRKGRKISPMHAQYLGNTAFPAGPGQESELLLRVTQTPENWPQMRGSKGQRAEARRYSSCSGQGYTEQCSRERAWREGGGRCSPRWAPPSPVPPDQALSGGDRVVAGNSSSHHTPGSRT